MTGLLPDLLWAFAVYFLLISPLIGSMFLLYLGRPDGVG